MSRESSYDSSIVGYDAEGLPVTSRWPPAIIDEPPSPRPHTPVPTPRRARSRQSSLEEDFTTPGRADSPPVTGRARAESLDTRRRIATDTDARILSGASPARSEGGTPPTTADRTSTHPSADSLVWDDFADQQSTAAHGAVDAGQLAAALNRLAERHDPAAVSLFSEYSDTCSEQSLNTTMAPTQGADGKTVEECLAALETAARVFEDDLQGLAARDFPADQLRLKWAESDGYKKAINIFEPRLAREPAGTYPDDLKERVLAARRGFSAFCRDGTVALKEHENMAAIAGARPQPQVPSAQLGAPANNQPPIAASAARQTVVTDTVNTVCDQLEAMVTTVRELNVRPADERIYRTFTARATAVFDQIASLKQDARRAIDEAATCGLDRQMTDVSTRLRTLMTEEQNIRATDLEAKATFGAVNLNGREYVMKAPTFSGDAKSTDFYTFTKEWREFSMQKHVTDTQLLRILLKESLSGAAQRTCKDMESEEEVFARLKTMYGNPKVLINAKIDEIARMKRCEGTDARRREWLIDAHAALVTMEKLAVNHKITNSVYHTPIVDQVLRALRVEDGKKFKSFVKKKEREKKRAARRDGARTPSTTDGDDEDDEGEFAEDYSTLDAECLFKYLLSYLSKLIKDVSDDINFELTVHKFEDRSSRPSDQPARPSQKQNKDKTYTSQPLPSQPPSKPDGPKKKSKPSQPSAGKQSSPATSAPAKTGAAVIHANYREPSKVKCLQCPQQHEYIFYCPEFQKVVPVERMKLCHAARVCFRCLRSDSRIDLNRRREWWKDHQVDCQTEWTCMTDNCGKRPTFRQYHMLMCSWHIDENSARQEEFVKSLDGKMLSSKPKFFAHFPAFFSLPPSTAPINVAIEGYEVDPDINSNSIFMVHHTVINSERLLIFYDSGCMGAGISSHAAKVVKSTTVRPGPTFLGVAGGGELRVEYGDEQFAMKCKEENRMTLMTALQMDDCTSAFPIWDVKAAWGEIYREFAAMHDGKAPDLPKAPDQVGGMKVSIMIGIRYLRIFPTLLYHLPSGLGIYESKLECEEGNSLVLAGPHRAWNYATNQTNFHNAHFYFTQECRAFYFQSQALNTPIFTALDEHDVDQHREGLVEESPPAIDVCPAPHCDEHQGDEHLIEQHAYTLQGDLGRLVESENIGTEIRYRCLRCRVCTQCRDSENVDEMSLKEEREQAMIEESVRYDHVKKRLFSTLPFIKNPDEALKPNRYIAEKVLGSQLKVTSKDADAKADVLAAFEKLRSRGFIVKYDDLDNEVKSVMDLGGSKVTFTIPWRIVYKHASLSTPARLVFDASATTASGESLNNILAKGENKLIKLANSVLKFRLGAAGWTADVSMAYNQIFLEPEYYRYQLFLWKPDLDPAKPTEVWVVTTLIYGVRPSGNLMMAAFNLLADYAAERYPVHAVGGKILKSETYVDDSLHSASTMEKAKADAESFQFTLELASMGVKGFTFSSSPPPPEVSADGRTVGLVGMVWNTEPDLISCDVKPLFFGRVKRGKLPQLHEGDLKFALGKNFTKRQILSKIAGLWDPIGLLTPLTMQYKLNFSNICDLQTEWDQALPNELLDSWVSNIEEIQMAKDVVFRRAVVPADAASLDLHLIVSTDASQHAAAATVHVRTPLRGGKFHVQLLCAKSKLTKNATIPKAELKGAVLGASLGHVSKQCLGKLFSDITYVTDSAITLYWINSDSRPLETFVRNAVIEIRRLSKPDQWYHVASELNVADIATRKTTVAEIGIESNWQKGMPWKALPQEAWPLQTISQITVASEDKRIATKDTLEPALFCDIFASLKSQVSERYAFSKYLYDPNRFNWARAVRVVAHVIKFLRWIRVKDTRSKSLPDFKPLWAPPAPPTDRLRRLGSLDQHDLRFAAHYFFQKATREVKKFTPEKMYKDDTVERYGILYYTARILDGQQLGTVDEFLDLDPLCFVKPVVDRYSPVAYSIMLYAHATCSTHRSVPVTLTESRSIAYIFQGRNLAKEIYASCQYCRRNLAKTVEVEMGKIHELRLFIAPPYHVSQCDIMGPLVASCPHKPHRSTIKVWAVVFKCLTTCSISAHVMQDYSAASVVQAFTRFGTSNGFPTLLLIDQGTQLVSACENMRINIQDLTGQLNTKFQVGLEHQTSPTRAHNFQGQVERGIREIRKLLDKVFKGIKSDSIAWETNLAWITNELNNMPICTLSRTDDLGNLDILTPSRLLLGRANRRAMSGYPQLTKPSKIIEQMDRVYDAWFKIWREERIVDFIPQPRKWKRNNGLLQVGDIVIFMKELPDDHFGKPLWKVARITALEHSADGLARTCTVEYVNASQPQVFHKVRLSVRHVAKLHGEDDLDIIQELNEAAALADSLHD